MNINIMNKALILFLPIILICCTAKKQYDIDDLTILATFKNGDYDTISKYDFFDAMLRMPQQTNLLPNELLSYAIFPLPNQFGGLWVNDLNKSSYNEPEYIFIEKSNNQVISGNVIFNYLNFNLRGSLVEDEIHFVGYIENGKMTGQWKIPLQLAAITTYRDYLPSSLNMLWNFPIGLITINYKNGTRHGQMSITDVKDYKFYSCYYYKGKLHGYEKLNIVSAQNAYIGSSGLGVWGLNNYGHHWTTGFLPKQTIKYNKGQVVEMEIWTYDWPNIKTCISKLDNQNLSVQVYLV